MRVLSQREAFAYRLAMSDELYAQRAAHVDQVLSDLKHKGVETRTMPQYGHVAANGRTHWTPERRRQHQQVIRHFYDEMQQSGVPQEGKGLIMGGLGGAGKGHAQSQPDIPLDANNYYTIDPDRIKEYMAANGMVPQADHLSPMESSSLLHEETSDLAKRIAMLGYRQKRNLNWDITMSSPGSVAKRINTMRKMGYGQIDGAFVDADPKVARQRVENRHREGEEKLYHQGQGTGGRWVPSELTKGSMPTPGSGQLSKNAEVFAAMRPQFDNTLHIDATGELPRVRNQTGFRWKSGAFPTWQPSEQVQRAARRIAAWLRQADEAGFNEDNPDSVKGMVESYRQGYTDYPSLVEQLASADYSDPSVDEVARDWPTTYDRAETDPDDDSFFWVEAAADDGTLSTDQVDEIVEAIDHFHSQGQQ